MFYCLEGLRLFFVGVQDAPGFFDELIADIFPFWTDLIEEKFNDFYEVSKATALAVAADGNQFRFYFGAKGYGILLLQLA